MNEMNVWTAFCPESLSFPVFRKKSRAFSPRCAFSNRLIAAHPHRVRSCPRRRRARPLRSPCGFWREGGALGYRPNPSGGLPPPDPRLASRGGSQQYAGARACVQGCGVCQHSTRVLGERWATAQTRPGDFLPRTPVSLRAVKRRWARKKEAPCGTPSYYSHTILR